jgi:hypothetical protein
VTFLLVWDLQIERTSSLTAVERLRSVPLRDAIAASVVLVYLACAGWAIFFSRIVDGTSESLDPISATFLQSFTVVVSTVVGFYFVSDAYVRTHSNSTTLGRRPRTTRPHPRRSTGRWPRAPPALRSPHPAPAHGVCARQRANWPSGDAVGAAT